MDTKQQQQRSLNRDLVSDTAVGNGNLLAPHTKVSPYLDTNQQNLLLRALGSQAATAPSQHSRTIAGEPSQSAGSTMSATADNSDLYVTPQSAELDKFGEYSPDLDYLDGDSFDFENADLGGEMIGALPGGSDSDLHEKRGRSDENDDDDDGNQAKRHETQDGERIAKKPGRKPLTNEPTTKRKAQNRAAQRAFRERKEKHLKDLETQVAELTKSQEADKHENGMLKAQVERLQIELREYRKRLSLNSLSGSGTRSPPLAAQKNRTTAAAAYNNSPAFSFDFPKFGSLPQSQNWTQTAAPKRQSTASSYGTRSPSTGAVSSQSPNVMVRHDSTVSSVSPSNANSPGVNANAPITGYSTTNNMHGFANTLPQMNGADPFGDLFSPSLLKSASFDGNNFFGSSTGQLSATDATSGGESTAGFQRAFQFNSSSSASASPSASSASQWNAQATSSSCGTSPEPSHESPALKDKPIDTTIDSTNNTSLLGQSQLGNDLSFFNTTDFSVPTADTFDPVLFGGYRDNGTDNLFGTTDFSTGLFDEPFNTLPYDMSSPSNLFGILQSPKPTTNTMPKEPVKPTQTTTKPSDKFLASLDKTCNGGDDDYGLPSSAMVSKSPVDTKLISCNNIWSQLQTNRDFQDGKFDLDGLCSELRAKAKCSESGVMVPQEHVDAALRRLGDRTNPSAKPKIPNLMFEQESWDNVLKKLGNGTV